MFAEHQPQLSRLARSSPEGFERIVTFVLCTIRMSLRDAVKDYPIVRRGDRCRSIFGFKHDGLAYLRDHAASIWSELECVYECTRGEPCEDELMAIVTMIPGIGLAKGGFILQMMYGLSGCIDTHNLRRFGLTEETFATHGSRKKCLSLIRSYRAMIANSGGTAWLWDTWCAYLAERDHNYDSAETVSSLHLIPLSC